jgi:hypothetical protein
MPNTYCKRLCGTPNRELVAMHLKRQGQFICRTLSYHGCAFQVDEQALGPEALRVYDAAAELWIRLYKELNTRLDKGGLKLFPRKRPPKLLRVKSKKESGPGSECPSVSSSSEDSDSDSVVSFGDSKDIYGPMKLPYADGAAIMTIMRYFWGKFFLQQLFGGAFRLTSAVCTLVVQVRTSASSVPCASP